MDPQASSQVLQQRQRTNLKKCFPAAKRGREGGTGREAVGSSNALLGFLAPIFKK